VPYVRSLLSDELPVCDGAIQWRVRVLGAHESRVDSMQSSVSDQLFRQHAVQLYLAGLLHYAL